MVRTAIRDRTTTAPTTPTMFVGSAEKGNTRGQLVAGTWMDAKDVQITEVSVLHCSDFPPFLQSHHHTRCARMMKQPCFIDMENSTARFL